MGQELGQEMEQDAGANAAYCPTMQVPDCCPIESSATAGGGHILHCLPCLRCSGDVKGTRHHCQAVTTSIIDHNDMNDSWILNNLLIM